MEEGPATQSQSKSQTCCAKLRVEHLGFSGI